MLSSFAYSAFDAALASACLRGGVAHRRVNPAYTSIIGRVTFARRYGLSVHDAASSTIARRAMGCSERLPRSNDGTVTVPTNGSVHVTLDLPVRNGSRHVWAEWNGLNKELSEEGACSASIVGTQVPTPMATQDVVRAERSTAPWCFGGGGTFPPDAFSHATQGLVACQEKVPEMESSGW
jgi:hypothetical protein